MRTVQLALLTMMIFSPSFGQQKMNNWREENGIFELYGNSLENFLDIHPLSLILVYDESEQSKEVLELLPSIEKKMSEKNISILVGKMRSNDGPRWTYFRNTGKLPRFRFCISSAVSVSLKAYPNIENIVDWVSEIYKNSARITKIDSNKIKDKFQQEPNAFYLRFNPENYDYVDLLGKLQMLSNKMKIYYATNPAFDVFDNFNSEDVVIGFRRTFEDPVKFMSSPNKLNAENILRFFESFYQPTTYDLTKDLLEEILNKKITTAFFFGSSRQSKILDAFNYVAFEQKTNFLFAIALSASILTEEFRQAMDLTKDNEDQIRILEFDGKKFRVYKVVSEDLAGISNEFSQFNSKELKEFSVLGKKEEQEEVKLETDL